MCIQITEMCMTEWDSDSGLKIHTRGGQVTRMAASDYRFKGRCVMGLMSLIGAELFWRKKRTIHFVRSNWEQGKHILYLHLSAFILIIHVSVLKHSNKAIQW